MNYPYCIRVHTIVVDLMGFRLYGTKRTLRVAGVCIRLINLLPRVLSRERKRERTLGTRVKADKDIKLMKIYRLSDMKRRLSVLQLYVLRSVDVNFVLSYQAIFLESLGPSERSKLLRCPHY